MDPKKDSKMVPFWVYFRYRCWGLRKVSKSIDFEVQKEVRFETPEGIKFIAFPLYQVIEYFVTQKGIDQTRFELNAYSSVKGPVRESENPRRIDIIIRPKFRPAKEIKLDEIISQFN